MNFVVKKILKLREKYIDTLAKLYEYSTAIYEHNRLSQMLDSDMGYTYGSFKRKCDELSHLLSRYGIGDPFPEHAQLDCGHVLAGPVRKDLDTYPSRFVRK